MAILLMGWLILRYGGQIVDVVADLVVGWPYCSCSVLACLITVLITW